MNGEHEAHLQRILEAVNRDLSLKYRGGQTEHGGRLWMKPNLLDEAIKEALDLVVYLYTLKEQQERRSEESIGRVDPR